ncbi:MAG: hypothetical protein N2749_04745 [Clostridia bacterium]|nr:hypothetical protein [Clostridia bacterium]
MINKNFIRTIIILFTTLIFCLSTNISVFASSGNASLTANKGATFYVNVTGNTSLMAHLKIISMDFKSNQNVAIQVTNPKGKAVNVEGWILYKNGTTWFNFMNAIPGKYKVVVLPSDDSWFSVVVAIENGFYKKK